MGSRPKGFHAVIGATGNGPTGSYDCRSKKRLMIGGALRILSTRWVKVPPVGLTVGVYLRVVVVSGDETP